MMAQILNHPDRLSDVISLPSSTRQTTASVWPETKSRNLSD